VLNQLDAYTEATEAGAVEPELVAGIIKDMIEQQQPRPDRLVMKKKWLIRLLLQLPKRMQDRMIRKNVDASKRY